MKHKVSELTGRLLDAAVAEAEGMVGAWITDDNDETRDFRPSSDWADGGPLIEREQLDIVFNGSAGWAAGVALEDWRIAVQAPDIGSGPTPLIAAMRAYVASKFGDEVEL